MKKAVWILAFLVSGSAIAAGETTAAPPPPVQSGAVVGAGAQRAMQASFGSISVTSLTLGAVLWATVAVSAKNSTGTTGTN